MGIERPTPLDMSLGDNFRLDSKEKNPKWELKGEIYHISPLAQPRRFKRKKSQMGIES